MAAALRVAVADVEAAVALPGKKRYEIAGSRVRARYGHSTGERVEHPPAEPPELLFHGTSAAAVAAIARDGLRPMTRQSVHLSADRETALAVARRRRGEVALLAVAARAAYDAGVAFRDAGDGVWLADAVPAAYVTADAAGPLP